MKKFSLILAATFILFGHAQKTQGQAAILAILLGDKVASENFYFSFKLGANIGTVQGIEGVGYKPRLNFGLLANIRLTDKLFLIPEFSALSGKGAKDIPYISSGIGELDELIGESTDAHMRLNYIDMPVILRYQVKDRLHLGTGPQFGYLTSAKMVYDSNVQADDRLIYLQGSQLEWNSFDFGWTAEAMYRISKAFRGKTIDIHARYTYGITDIIKDNTGDAVTNSVFQVAISLPFIVDQEK